MNDDGCTPVISAKGNAMLSIKPGFLMPPGKQPRYEILEQLSPKPGGEGAMGVVWKAKDRHRSKDEQETYVAIKFHRYGADTNTRSLFDREAKILMKLMGHPNILTVLDVDEYHSSAGEFRFVVTEYCHSDLSGVAKKGIHSDITAYLQIATDTCRGLECAHNDKLVHRDIKPANLFVASDLMTVKLGDFGIAKDKSEPTEPGTAMRAGTRFYKAPERISPEQDLTLEEEIRADIYSLGVTFYQILTSAFPYPDGHHHFISSRKDPCDLNLKVPKEIGDLVSKMIEFDPNKRPDNVTIVLDALEGVKARRRDLTTL